MEACSQRISGEINTKPGEHLLPKGNETDGLDLPGVIEDLGSLPPKSLITDDGVARIFGRHVASVKRAVDRGELPPPVRIFGKSSWTVEAITEHIAKRLAKAADQRESRESKYHRLAP